MSLMRQGLFLLFLCAFGLSFQHDDHRVLSLSSSDGEIVALMGASFEGVVIDGYSQLSLTLSFRNRANESYADVSLLLPTDPRAAVFKTTIQVGNRAEILMEMRPREEADQLFSRAKESGQGAYLSARDFHQADVTRISIGNLPPEETVKVTLHYVAYLILESDSSLRFSLPVGMIHRYPASSSHGDLFSDHSSLGGDDVVAPIAVNVQFNMSAPIQAITSPTSNPFELTFITALGATAHAKARLIANISSQLTSFTGEYALVVKFQQPLPPTLYVMEEDQGGHAANAIVLAELVGDKAWAQQQQQQQQDNSNAQLFEVFFVVDQSGSMSGEGNELAIETLFLTLSALPEGSLFQVIAFGSHFTELFPGGQTAVFDDDSKAKALAYARTLTADLGGTEILAPLEAIARTYPRTRPPRYVFVLTDGEVSNTDEVVNFVRADHRQSGTRYFTFGIGAGASRALCEGVAEASLGVAEMITASRSGHAMSVDIATKTSRQLKRIMAPTLTDIEMGLFSSSTPSTRLEVAQQAPTSIAPLFQDARQLVYFELPEGSKVPADLTATVAGSLLDNIPISTVITHVRSMPATMLRVLAARAFLAELEAQYDHLGETASGQEDTEYKQRRLKEKAVSLSVAQNVVSKFTAQVAVEERSEAERASSSSGEKIVRNLFLSRVREEVAYETAYNGMSFGTVTVTGGTVMDTADVVSGIDMALDVDSGSSDSLIELMDTAPLDLSELMDTAPLDLSELMDTAPLDWSVGDTVETFDIPASSVQDESQPSSEATKAAVFDVMSAQGSDGSWKTISPRISALCAATTAAAALAGLDGATQQHHLHDKAILSTLVTMRCLETEMGAFSFLWSMAVDKAARFVAGVTGWAVIAALPEEGATFLAGLQSPAEVRLALGLGSALSMV